MSEGTGRSDLFAALRLWEPAAQHSAPQIINQLINDGVGVNDRDELTDMTLLHFAVKAGARGIALDPTAADTLVRDLLDKGGDINATAQWTDMNAVHLAAFFDCANILELLVSGGGADLTARSDLFDGASALHLAVHAGHLECVKALLFANADVLQRDNNMRTPLDVAEDLLADGNGDVPASIRNQIVAALRTCAENTLLKEEAAAADEADDDLRATFIKPPPSSTGAPELSPAFAGRTIAKARPSPSKIPLAGSASVRQTPPAASN
eukprot:m.591380 g.591380  ORF g.591380 m.591380 type:complete len:267 (-) comp58014_c0_seq2:1078-1878(-)